MNSKYAYKTVVKLRGGIQNNMTKFCYPYFLSMKKLTLSVVCFLSPFSTSNCKGCSKWYMREQRSIFKKVVTYNAALKSDCVKDGFVQKKDEQPSGK